MALFYFSGPLTWNLVNSGTVTSTNENSNFPVVNIKDRPFVPFKFNTAAADMVVTVDLGSSQSADFVSIHGNNIDSGITATELRKSTDNFAADDVLVATLTEDIPTFYSTFTSQSSRYWRLKFVGTNGSPIEIGTWVLGARNTLTRAQLVEWQITDIQPQIRQSGDLVRQNFTINLTEYYHRLLSLEFIATNLTQRDEIQDTIYRTAGFGTNPTLIVPDENDTIAIYGTIQNELVWDKIPGPSGGYHRTTMELLEDPFWLN